MGHKEKQLIGDGARKRRMRRKGEEAMESYDGKMSKGGNMVQMYDCR